MHCVVGFTSLNLNVLHLFSAMLRSCKKQQGIAEDDASRYLTTSSDDIIKPGLIEREHFKLLNKLLYCKFDSVTHRHKDTVEKPLRTRAQKIFPR